MKRVRLIALLFAGLAFLGACGQGEDPGLTAPEASPAETAEARDDATGREGEVRVSEDGDFLVDAEGRTLYVFLNDQDGRSACTGECAENWPPLTVEGEATAGEGVGEGELGTIEREDGDTQVTYHDRPLYYFAADKNPGDVKGQGVGDVWFVVSAEGEPLRDFEPEGAASPSP